MQELETGLSACFAAVFSSLTPEQIRNANPDNVTGWDSVATVTLLALIDEKFGIFLDIDELGPELSFLRMLEQLQQSRCR